MRKNTYEISYLLSIGTGRVTANSVFTISSNPNLGAIYDHSSLHVSNIPSHRLPETKGLLGLGEQVITSFSGKTVSFPSCGVKLDDIGMYLVKVIGAVAQGQLKRVGERAYSVFHMPDIVE